MTQEEHFELLKEVCGSTVGELNIDAVNFLIRVGKVFRVWDNSWDQDKPNTKEDYDTVFSDLAFDLNRNSFYREHRDVLDAQIFLAWNCWHDSNEWHGNENTSKGVCAWFIRDYCNEIVPLVAWLLFGKEHARDISLRVREAYLRELQEGGDDGFIRIFSNTKDRDTTSNT